MGPLKLSVVMPNHNHACYIAEALDAIVSQSLRPFEVIVCDDASTDNSVEIIQRFVDKYQFVRLIRNDTNQGVLTTIDKLVALTSGDYLYFAGADDKVLPGLFQKSMETLTLYPQAGLCCSDVVNFNDTEGFSHIKRSRLGSGACYLSAEEIVKIIRKSNAIIGSVSCLMKRSSFMEVGGYIPELKWNCDWFLISVIAFRYGICYIPEPLSSQRILRTSYSFTNGNNWRSRTEMAVNIIRFLGLPAYDDVRKSFIKSYSMAIFGIPMLHALSGCEKNRKHVSLPLLIRILWSEFRLFLGRATPCFIKKQFVRLCKTVYKR